MLGKVALKSRARALAITGVITLGVVAAIVLVAGASAPTFRAGSAIARPAAATPARAAAIAAPADARRALSKRDAAARFASLPLYFEPNVGQTDPRVRFLSQSSRYALFLTDSGAVLSLVGGRIHKGPTVATIDPPPPPDRLVTSAVRIRMADANPHPQMNALDLLHGRVNYLIGNDPSKYHHNIPTYGRVRVRDVYPGIDVIYYGTPSALEYDIVAAPGADPSRIRFAIEGGAETIVDANGDIRIVTAAGTITMRKPQAYQHASDGSEVPVDSSFAAVKQGARTEYTIRLARFDRARPLIIDPTVQILYSSYLGGNANITGPVNLEQFSGLTNNAPLTVADVGTDVALDPSDKAYITGVAYSSTGFPLVSAFQSTQTAAAGQNPVGFIAKFDTTKSGASSLIYSTYFGGSGDTGSVNSGDGDLPFGIAVDASGDPFIVGQTYSTDFPQTATCGGFGKAKDGGAAVNNGFVAKLNSTGSAVVYSCYINGTNNATESRVALFPAGCGGGTLCKAYVSGTTQSDHATGFPTTGNAFQNTLKGLNGKSNATFIVVHEDGQSLDYATLYGGSGNGKNADAALSVAVDSKGRGYIAGATFSSDLTTKNPAVASYNPKASSKKVSNVFVAKFDPTLSGAASLLYATYLGGSGATGTLGPPINFALSLGDLATAVRIDPVSGLIWVAGVTASTDFTPSTAGTVFQSSNAAAAAAGAPATAGFIAELDTSKAGLNQVAYRTYFGGGGLKLNSPFGGSIGIGDAIVDLAVTGPLIYVTGATSSGTVANGFPLSASACQTLNTTSGILFGGLVNVPITAFAAEIDPSKGTSPAQLAFSTLLGGTGTADAGTGLAIDASGDMVISGLTYSADFPVTTTAFQGTNNATGNSATNAFLTVLYPAGTDCGKGGGTPVPTPSSTPTPAPTPTPGGKIAISANPVVFPNAGLGAAPTDKNFLVQNLSAKHHLVGSVGSPGTASFIIISGGGPLDLGPLGVGKVKMQFKPSGTGLEKDSLTITSNDKLTPALIVKLRGTGEPGRLTTNIPLLPPLFQPILAFGHVLHGTTKSLNFKIKNVGLGVLAGNVPALGGTFTVTVGFGAFNLAPGATQLITVKFAPTTTGHLAQALVITVTPPGKPAAGITVTLRGKGTA